MRLFGRFFRLVWGDDVPGPLRPVLAVQFCGSVAMSALWTYIGIWALERLDASSTAIGITFTCGALAATATRVPRRPPLGLPRAQAAHPRRLRARVGLRPRLPGRRRPRAARSRARRRRERARLARAGRRPGARGRPRSGGEARAGVRVRPGRVEPRRRRSARRSADCSCSARTGPLFPGVAVMAGARLPRRPPLAAAARRVHARGPAGARLVRRDPPGPRVPALPRLRRARLPRLRLLRDGAADHGVDSHGLSPSTWGFLVIINPALVTFFQLRLTRRVEHIPAAPKLARRDAADGLPVPAPRR